MPAGQSIESQRYACRVSWMLSLTHSCRRSDSSLPSAVGRPQSKRGRTFEDGGGQRGSQGRQNGRGKRSGVKASLLPILRDAGSSPSLPWERRTRAARQ
jgi:hypothetical protein